jgi:hypothetical protein
MKKSNFLDTIIGISAIAFPDGKIQMYNEMHCIKLDYVLRFYIVVLLMCFLHEG